MLTSVVNNGTGRPARVFGEGDIAGKTGTTQSNAAVWFAGYTPEIAGVAMISVDNTRAPFSKALRAKGKDYRSRGVKNYTVPSTGAFLSGTGSGDAGEEIWKPVMTEYLKRVPNTSFQDPPEEVEIGKQVPMPDVTGLGLLAGQRKLEAAGFTVEKQYVFSDTEPKWDFIEWSPAPGAMVSEFGTIHMVYSKGRDPEVVEAEKQKQEEEAEQERQRQEADEPPGPR
jgi:membrane carboxypeptidase/penicillin-binding protein